MSPAPDGPTSPLVPRWGRHFLKKVIMILIKKILILFLILLVWNITTSCAPKDGCYGYWKDRGLKKGTISKNRFYISPYRQCVKETPPHRNTKVQWQK